MSRQTIYLLLLMIGVVVPYVAFVPWLLDHGLDIPRLLDELFANRVSTFFALDVIVSALVLWVFIGVEARQTRTQHAWAPVLVSLTVGVSAALPLFLYLRESALGKDAVV